ncbi:MAG: hypothetical protein BWZ04_02641 [Firmicutes bacterium ADurb.BinA205]|nr:MAG: hypothetical protein BWZ04_02641 [Firmicutes bacterium ADurb.BinA205]
MILDLTAACNGESLIVKVVSCELFAVCKFKVFNSVPAVVVLLYKTDAVAFSADIEDHVIAFSDNLDIIRFDACTEYDAVSC